ncbi:hypothetical protein [Micromonospora sp. NPDC047740]|uniref:hypothetical protein n=1 Tax=Micromonospora sp. NPDC047740 TaxID=3364254 RepID=UPI003717C068
MAGLPRVVASGKRIAEVRGTDMYLLTVELWSPNQVTVRLVGELNDRMRSAVASYHAAMESLSPDRGRDAVPRSPGEELFKALQVRLSDEVGTAYNWESGSSGGTGQELLCEWRFRASHELHGNRLTLTVTSSEGVGGSEEIVFPS